MLSVIIPAYNEEKMIPKTAEAVGKVLQEAAIDYEIIFINDGSKDGTWDAIRACHAADERVRGGCLSRNFGKEGAMRAGLAMCKGDCAVIMDCDLQDPPEKIPEMYALWQQGYEIVAGVKHSRGKESAGYGLMTKLFYSAMSSALNTDMSRASDFKLLDRKAILVILNMQEQNIFFRAVSSWVGFKTIEIEFDVQERTEGTSKWSKWSLVKYAINNITSYTMLPLHVIHSAGASVFRGVVMADGQDGGVVEHCILHNQANVHQGLCDAALRQLDMLNQSVVLVHQQQVGFLHFEILAERAHELMYSESR